MYFTNLETWAARTVPGEAGTGTRWLDGDLGYTIAVRGTIPPLLQQTCPNPIRATFSPDYGLAFAQILPTNSRASCSSESTAKSRSSKTLSTNRGP